MMPPFEYARPETLEQASRLLGAEPGKAAALAGGSDLLGLMKDGVETPERLVSLKALDGISRVRPGDGGGLRIGALVTLDELVADASVGWEYPALAQAALRIGGPQVRNVATVGGNLCQRPRCWYYRNGFGLLAQREGKSLVAEGDNRHHAILGNDGPAAFVQPSTLAPLLIALGARLTLFSLQGGRQIELKDFFRIPRAEGEREHDLRPGELVTEVLLPPAAERKVATYELRPQEAPDWPLASASVALEMEDRTVKKAALVLGQVAPVPWVVPAAAEFLHGKMIADGIAAQAAELALQGAKPLSRNQHKVQLARVVVKRALLTAAGQWQEVSP